MANNDSFAMLGMNGRTLVSESRYKPTSIRLLVEFLGRRYRLLKSDINIYL